MSDEKTCRNCVMYQDGYCNRDGMHADKTKPGYSCRWWIGGKTMSEKLKRCPFCGGNAELESSYADYVGSGLHKIVCKVCGCQTNYEHPMQKAIDLWNRRAEK